MWGMTSPKIEKYKVLNSAEAIIWSSPFFVVILQRNLKIMRNDTFIQLIIAALLALAGIALLFVGALLAPQGEIHDSILVAFGEIATFAGSIIGIDYHYKKKHDHAKTNPPNPKR